jgi:tetraacyldisaccharide 4'-kinase
MSIRLERVWYRASLTPLTICLLPLSWLFSLVTSLRRFLYRIKIKKSVRFPVPVIVVGNITVGGTGKTPCVIWLAQLLRERGFTPGIVSRGVGGEKHSEPFWVNAYAGASEAGDEAILLAKRTECPVVICVNRVAAVKELLANTSCNIVISDDGLQHYHLARDIEIAIIDSTRMFGNRQLLPAGPLREPVSRLKNIDFILTNPPLPLSGMHSYGMLLQGETFVSLLDESKKISLNNFIHKKIHAVAAIGNPSRFFTMLRQKGFDVIEHIFPDHYFFTAEDLNFAGQLPVVMTEKDAVKCHGLVDERFWYIPVEAEINDLSSVLMSALSRLPDKN